ACHPGRPRRAPRQGRPATCRNFARRIVRAAANGLNETESSANLYQGRPMQHDSLVQTLFTEIGKIPLIDPHTHINPHRAAARSLDDILGYHYYTELAHSVGMDKAPLAGDVAPRERVRQILTWMDRFDNTAQYSWFVEIARTFLGFQGDRVTA